MAGGRLLSRSATLVMLMVVELLLQSSVQRVKIINPSSSLAVASNADVTLFPGRNSGLHRRPRTHDVPPLCKLQAGLKLLNISLAASFLVVLAGDVSLNPGPETDHCALCTKGCQKNQRAVQCDECDRWFHAKCINMNHHEYLDISALAAYRSCMDCLFPEPFSASNVSYDPKTSTSYDSINAPKVRLVRGLQIAHLIVNRLVNKLDGVRVLMCLHEVKPGFPRTYLTVKSLYQGTH